MYGDRSPAGTENATYAIDGGPPSQYVEDSVAGLPKHKVIFFNSSVLPAGTHTLVTTNYGNSLLLDFFLVGLQDDDASSGTFTQPQSSTLPQPSQTTPAFTTSTEAISTSSSSSGSGGYAVPASPLITGSHASMRVSSAQGATTTSASYLLPEASSHNLTNYVPPTAFPSGIPSQRLSSKLSKGASAGLAVGISVFCLLVGCGILAWYCLFYRHRRRAEIVSGQPHFGGPNPHFTGSFTLLDSARSCRHGVSELLTICPAHSQTRREARAPLL